MNYSAVIAEIENKLPPEVTLAPEARQIMERALGAIVNAGAVANGKFRNGDGEVNQETLIRRAIIGLQFVLNHPDRCRIGLIDVTPENLAQQREVLIKQVQLLLPASQEDKSRAEIASDIADVILTSWALTLK